MTWARRGRAGVALAVALLASPAARADRVAVAPPVMHGGGAALVRPFRASVAGGVAAAGHEAIDPAAIDRALEATPAIAACDTDLCLGRLVELVGARAALRTTVEVLGSSNYSFRLEIVDGGRTTARVDDACSICTTREANDALSRAAAAVARRLTPRPVAATAPTAPARASSGPAPPAPTRSWPRRARVLLGLGVAATVLGAGAIGGGAALLALDGRTRYGTDPITGDPVASTFDGKIPGAILVAGGGLLVVGGALLLWRAAVAHRR